MCAIYLEALERIGRHIGFALAVDAKLQVVIARKIHIANICSRNISCKTVESIINPRTETCVASLVESFVGINHISRFCGVEPAQAGPFHADRYLVEHARTVHHPFRSNDRTLGRLSQMALVPVVGLDETRIEGTQTNIELRIVELVVTVCSRQLPNVGLALLPLRTVACCEVEDATFVEARRRNGESLIFRHHLSADILLGSRFRETCSD